MQTAQRWLLAKWSFGIFIEKWCDKKPDVKLQYLDYEEYMKVQKNWFDKKKKEIDAIRASKTGT